MHWEIGHADQMLTFVLLYISRMLDQQCCLRQKKAGSGLSIIQIDTCYRRGGAARGHWTSNIDIAEGREGFG